MTSPAWPPPAPLCAGGRCEQILAALAKARLLERVVDEQSVVLEKVLRSALSKLDIDHTNAEVGQAVADAIREVTTPASERISA